MYQSKRVEVALGKKPKGQAGRGDCNLEQLRNVSAIAEKCYQNVCLPL